MSGTPNLQTIHIPLDGGMDQRTSRYWVQSPNVLESVNTRFRRVGGVEKRPGTTLVETAFQSQGGGGLSIGSTKGKVIGFRDEVVVSDGVNVGSLATVAGFPKLIHRGKAPEAVATMASFSSSSYSVSYQDVACADGLAFYVWSTSTSSDKSPDAGGTEVLGNVFYSVQDMATGAYVVSNQLLSGSGSTYGLPRLVAIGSTVLAFYNDNASNIYVHIWNSTNRVFGTATAIVTDMATTSRDFDVSADGTNAFIVYRSTANVIRIRRVSTAGAITASINSTEAATNAREFGICATAGEVVWISYVITSGGNHVARAAAYTLTLSAESPAPFTIITVAPATESLSGTSICRRSATTAALLIGSVTTAPGGRGGRNVRAPVINTSGAIVAPATPAQRVTYWCFPASKPFQIDPTTTKVYAWLLVGGARYGTPSTVEQDYQFTMVLADLGYDETVITLLQARPVTWVAPRFTSADSTYKPASCVSAAGKWMTAFRIIRSAAGRRGLATASADFAHPGHLSGAELGQTLFVVPGHYWDGTRLAEIGFAYWPQKLGTPTFAAGGTLVNGTTYRWRVVYEYRDALGFVHRSQPSDYIEATATDTKATFPCPSLCVTARPTSLALGGQTVRLVLYRTDDITVDPNTYYRVRDDAGVEVNQEFAESVTLTDTGTKQLDTLYTQGGVLPNVMPHGCTAMATYRNRLWIAYGNTVAYSKAFVTGETVSFSDAFTLPLEESGSITALWVQDDTLFISTENRIYYLAADGPSDTGGQNDVSTPNRIATDLGVSNPRSIVVTPLGTIYESAVGLQLLDRSRNVAAEPLSSRVQDDLAVNPTITSALVHPTGSYVMFTCNGSASGIRLVFDYTTGKWSRDEVLGSGASAKKIISAAVANGTVHFLSGGFLYRENPATFIDDGAWITMSVTLAEIHPAGLQGFLGFRKWTYLNERSTDHDLALSWFKDYEAAAFRSETVQSSSLTGLINQFSRNPNIHRAQTMRTKIADALPTGSGAVIGTGRGAAFIGLAVEVDPLDNKTFRLPAAQKG